MIESIVLENEKTKNRIIIDKTTTNDYILGEVDFGQVGSKSSTYKYVNQIGYDKEATMLETRKISIQGWIISTDVNEESRNIQMTNRKSMLNSFVNPQQNITIYYSDYKISFTPDNSVKYAVPYAENNNTIVKFEITGIAYDPCFYDKTQQQTEAGVADGMFHFPMIISDVIVPETVVFGVLRPDKYFYINSRSNIDVGFEIILKAIGYVTNPIILNIKTQEFMLINKQLHDEEVCINTEIGKRQIISKSGDVETNYFKYKSFDSTWLQITQGENIFSYQASAGVENLQVFIKYNNKYLEVQQCN